MVRALRCPGIRMFVVAVVPVIIRRRFLLLGLPPLGRRMVRVLRCLGIGMFVVAVVPVIIRRLFPPREPLLIIC